MEKRLLTLVSSSNLLRVFQTQVRMTTSFTNSPGWIQRMKMRFDLLDADNNGILGNADIALVAKNIATYRNEGSNAEKHYFKILQSVTLAEEQGVTEKEFIEQAKKFVSQPDAKEHVKKLADMVFEVVDANKDGVISYEEYSHFYRAFNARQEMIDAFFKAADTNGDGVIDPSETQESYSKYFFSA